ncbi:hypothetical protein JOB18_039434 [Solea senegalensis]|uniref:Uncharacterized protein n=1 Tax=Solea senegalensis TaxID=28829 RepID=A0AAV6RVF1_SOLSE|nr:hypothetical protein JOB18_039434 [Solea senegalensis]
MHRGALSVLFVRPSLQHNAAFNGAVSGALDEAVALRQNPPSGSDSGFSRTSSDSAAGVPFFKEENISESPPFQDFL